MALNIKANFYFWEEWLVFLLSAAVLLVWMFQSAEAAEGMMSFICCIVLAVLSVSMGINHFMMAFPFQRKTIGPEAGCSLGRSSIF